MKDEGLILKKKCLKKVIVSTVLMATLVGINAINVFAGTNREFWDMTIRTYRNQSQLTTRNKENNNQYSWVKITSMNSVDKVTVAFLGPTWTISESTAISLGEGNFDKWVKLNYKSYTAKDTPIFLAAQNYYNSSKSGSISGVVDYE